MLELIAFMLRQREDDQNASSLYRLDILRRCSSSLLNYRLQPQYSDSDWKPCGIIRKSSERGPEHS
jgi:hypothetical protein